MRLVVEVPIRHPLDVIERHRAVLIIHRPEIIITEAGQLVHSHHQAQLGVILHMNATLPDDTVPGAGQLFLIQPVRFQFLKLGEDLFFASADVLWCRADVKSEIAGIKAQQLVRANIVAQAQFVAETTEDP